MKTETEESFTFHRLLQIIRPLVSLWIPKCKNPVILCVGAETEGPDRHIEGD